MFRMSRLDSEAGLALNPIPQPLGNPCNQLIYKEFSHRIKRVDCGLGRRLWAGATSESIRPAQVPLRKSVYGPEESTDSTRISST